MIYEVKVTPELVVQWATTGAVISARCLEGIPEGCRLVDCRTVTELGGATYVAIRFRHGEMDEPRTRAMETKMLYERIEP